MCSKLIVQFRLVLLFIQIVMRTTSGKVHAEDGPPSGARATLFRFKRLGNVQGATGRWSALDTRGESCSGHFPCSQ